MFSIDPHTRIDMDVQLSMNSRTTNNLIKKKKKMSYNKNNIPNTMYLFWIFIEKKKSRFVVYKMISLYKTPSDIQSPTETYDVYRTAVTRLISNKFQNLHCHFTKKKKSRLISKTLSTSKNHVGRCGVHFCQSTIIVDGWRNRPYSYRARHV